MRASGATCTQRTASGSAGTSAGVHGSPIGVHAHEAPVAVVGDAEDGGRRAWHVVDRRAERLDLRDELVAVLGRAARVDPRLHLEPPQRAGAVERPAADLRRPVAHQVAREVAEHGDHARQACHVVTARRRTARASSTIAR